MKVGWVFILSTSNKDKANKVFRKLRGVVKPHTTAITFSYPEKYYKGGFRAVCETEHESEASLHRLLREICYTWTCGFCPLQGNTARNCRVVGLGWVNFEVKE